MSAPILFDSEWFVGVGELAAREWTLADARAVAAGGGDAAIATAWEALCAADFAGTAVPVTQNGSGLGLGPVLEVAAAVGAALLPARVTFEAFLPSLVLRAMPGNARLDRLATEIATGTRVGVAIGTEATAGDRRLDFVHGIVGAAFCLVVEPGASRVLLVEVKDLQEVVALQVLDGREIGSAVLPAAVGEVVADGPDVARVAHDAHWIGSLLAAADALGAASTALEQAIAYASDRQQFGASIGSFQAVKHAIVDRFVDLQVGRALLASASEGPRIEPVAAAMAKAHANLAAVRCTNTAIQVHGAIGFTDELGLHLYQRRALVDRELFAGTGECLALVRTSLGLGHRGDGTPKHLAPAGEDL